MAVMKTFDEFLARIGNGFYRQVPLQSKGTVNSVCISSGPNDSQFTKVGKLEARYTVPSMESGVSAYIPLRVMYSGASDASLMIGRLTNLGDLDISGASGTFTDGSAMPTYTELGVASVSRPSMVIAEVTTVLSALPGTFTITYVDQDGNTAEAGPSNTLVSAAAVGACGYVQLNSADWGVRDITTAARASGTTPTGVLRFWGIEPIAFFESGPANSGSPIVMEDFIMQSLNLFPLAAGSLIGGFYFGSLNTFSAVTSYGYGQLFFVGDQT